MGRAGRLRIVSRIESYAGQTPSVNAVRCYHETAMRQAEAIPVTVEDEEAQKLLARLTPGLYEEILDAINSTRNGVDVASIVIRSVKSWEDPDWEELSFGVTVTAPSKEALAYWNRIGEMHQRLIDTADQAKRQQLVELVSIYVDWR